MKLEDALRQLDHESARARTRIGVERALQTGFLALMAAGAWALIALSGAHAALPFIAQSLTGIAAVAIIAALMVRAVQAWRPASEEEARARLALDSKLDPGAFETLRDQPTRYDAFSTALWARARERALEHVARMKHGRFAPRLDTRDPYRLRYVLLAGLVATLLLAGAAAPDRLARAFLPDPGPLLGDKPMAIEAWATPSEYTHAAPVSISDAAGQRIETPPSISVTVRVTGPAGAPRLVFRGAERRQARFARAADGAWEASLALPGPGRLSIVRFHERAFWRLAPAPDAAPKAEFTAPPTKLANDQVSIAWRGSDDYGLRRLVLRVRPVAPPPGLARADPIDTDLEAPAGDPREASAETLLELVAHPYAGMEVEARIVAMDALGQEGVSAPQRFTLPEKVFLQPLARAAIEIRRHVLAERRAYRPAPRARRQTMRVGDIVLGNQRIAVRDYDARPALRRAPEGVRRAARLLDALTMDPQDGYFKDLAVFLALRLARSELDAARDIDETAIAADTLWHAAMRAEYGGAADARRALEAAQQELSDALKQGAPQDRIDQLTQAMREAMQRYMQALAQEAMRDGGQSSMEDTQDQAEISANDIDAMLDEVRRLSQQGRKAEAEAMLQTLANILANLDMRMEQAQGEGEGEEQQRMQESMDQLSQTMGEQRALNDETQRAQQEQQQQQQQQNSASGGGGEREGGQGGDELAQRQAEIRQGLAEAQRLNDESGGAASEQLGAADEAMGQSENALRRGDIEGARNAQAAALESLRDSADALASAMREAASSGRPGERAGNGEDFRDPLNRPATGTATARGSNYSIGDGEGDPSRARETFDEILRRAQDPNRPEAEREYLRRLLDRFGDS